MKYNKSIYAMNVDVHWLTLSRADVLQAIKLVSGHEIPPDASLILCEDGELDVEWRTPKTPK